MNGISVRRIKLPVLCEVVRLMSRLQKEVATLKKREHLQKLKKQSSHLHQATSSHLPHSQREYFSYFKHASSNIAVVTLNGSILDVNHCFCANMKRPADELVGSSLFSFIHPSSLPLLYKSPSPKDLRHRNICLLLDDSARPCSQFLCLFRREEVYEPHLVILQCVSAVKSSACFMVTLVALADNSESIYAEEWVRVRAVTPRTGRTVFVKGSNHYYSLFEQSPMTPMAPMAPMAPLGSPCAFSTESSFSSNASS